MYYHVIMFNFLENLSDDEVSLIFNDLGELKNLIPQIVSYHFGANDANNVHNKGFGYCFVMTFANKLDRYIYQNHPLHKEFIKTRISSVLNEAIVLDFEST